MFFCFGTEIVKKSYPWLNDWLFFLFLSQRYDFWDDTNFLHKGMLVQFLCCCLGCTCTTVGTWVNLTVASKPTKSWEWLLIGSFVIRLKLLKVSNNWMLTKHFLKLVRLGYAGSFLTVLMFAATMISLFCAILQYFLD